MVLIDSKYFKNALYLGMYRARHNDLNEDTFKKLVSSTYYSVFEVEFLDPQKSTFIASKELIDKVVFMDST